MSEAALAIAREQILHMQGPLEVNEVLTILDEACELAEMSPAKGQQYQIRKLEEALRSIWSNERCPAWAEKIIRETLTRPCGPGQIKEKQ